MKICIVCSGNFDNSLGLEINKPAVYEQIIELEKNGFIVDIFLIDKKGIWGYFKKIFSFRKSLKTNSYNLIHAHSGLSAFLVALSTSNRFVVTFHGSDINNFFERIFSAFAAYRSSLNIYVSKKLLSKSFTKRKAVVIPCGVNLSLFSSMQKKKAREILNLNMNTNYVLFSSRFDNKVKNAKLAFNAQKKSNNKFILLELKDKTREEVMLFLNASDLLLLTSISEGSPQIIKEALACDRPIIAVDVGDVKERLNNIDNCFIVPFNRNIIANKIDRILLNDNQVVYKGRSRVLGFSIKNQTALLIEKYKSLNT